MMIIWKSVKGIICFLSVMFYLGIFLIVETDILTVSHDDNDDDDEDDNNDDC